MFTELAELGERKWLDGLDGTNDTGALLVTVEYWEESRKFHLFVYDMLCRQNMASGGHPCCIILKKTCIHLSFDKEEGH